MRELDGKSRRSDLLRIAVTGSLRNSRYLKPTRMANLGPNGTYLLTKTNLDKIITIKVDVDNKYQDTGTGAKSFLDQDRLCNAAQVSLLSIV